MKICFVLQRRYAFLGNYLWKFYRKYGRNIFAAMFLCSSYDF